MMRREKVIGLVLTSTGCGMLVVMFIPWWGFLLAGAMVAVGLLLLLSKNC